jgi:hypothetical protein
MTAGNPQDLAHVFDGVQRKISEHSYFPARLRHYCLRRGRTGRGHDDARRLQAFDQLLDFQTPR